MEENIQNLKPAAVWRWFLEICKIPRPSKKEWRMTAFLEAFARERKLDFKRDELGSVLISKPATKGKESCPTIVLQSHLDMVCEKNNDVQHDFEKDSIKPRIVDGWVTATGTTLGADDGIGIATQLAILDSNDLQHGKIECLFTVDEETGLSGAFALKPDFFTGKTLLNLDSEDEGILFVGCAGGIDTLATFKYKSEPLEKGYFPIKLEVKGLLGGHSGDDINKGRACAIKLLVNFIWDAMQKYPIRISSISGGNLRNAIARDASALILVPSALKESIVVDFNVYRSYLEERFGQIEKNLELLLESDDMPQTVIAADDAKKLIYALQALLHGVYRMSRKLEGMVETSTNLASVRMVNDSEILVTTSQRSESEEGKSEMASMVRSVFELAGASVVHTDGYPGWDPNPDSAIVAKTVAAYKKLFGKDPVVRTIHAGLECGLFLKKYPGLDMVSFGPTLRDVHSPNERINIDTVEAFWKLVLSVIE